MIQPDILPLTGIPRGMLPAAVIVCGDPDRANMVAGQFDSAELVSHRREYRTLKGIYKGVPVAVCSHGIGAPGAAIAFEEIIAAGGRRIVRVGTCGSLQPGFSSGHLVIATGAVSNSGYIKETVPEGYPALADLELTLAIKKAASATDSAHTLGIVLTRDNFYAGVEPTGVPNYQQMSEANVVAVEMECAALFVIGSLRKIQTAAILAVDGNVLESGGEMMDDYQPRHETVIKAVDSEIVIALEAQRRVHENGEHDVPG